MGPCCLPGQRPALLNLAEYTARPMAKIMLATSTYLLGTSCGGVYSAKKRSSQLSSFRFCCCLLVVPRVRKPVLSGLQYLATPVISAKEPSDVVRGLENVQPYTLYISIDRGYRS